MLTLRSSFTLALAALVFASFPSNARADIPPPEVEACFGKKPGDACSGRGVDSGQCAQSTCTTVRPSPEGIKEYHSDCVKCIPGAPTPPSPAKTEEPASAPAPQPQKVAPGPTNKSSGCSVQSVGLDEQRAGAFALLGMGVLGWIGLRRKNKSRGRKD